MATSLSLMGEHLSCPICLDIFKNPVVLKCSHSFCEDCLQKNWKEVVNRLCPVCRKECYSEEPCPSLALRSLCESIQKITENNQAEHYCQLHEEKLKLFCFDDKQPICVVCHTSKKHKGHECNPIEEIVPGLKNKIQAMISSSVNKLQNEKITHQNWSEHIKGQFQCAEEQIREEFNKLHQFLEEEETAKIGALREEQEQKDEVMQERAEALTRETETLAETTVVVNKEMDVDNITFLQNYKTIMNRANCVSTDTEDIETVSGVLVDMANHLGSLKFKVWEKMLEIIDYIPVTLDPNTTSFMLAVADDLRTLKYSNWQNYPNNTERFQKNVGVLGSEGFSEGIHFWDVEARFFHSLIPKVAFAR
ncbi:hypothetical protein DPEC_G00348950 [Dallia pectoralis]|uniref:Uncharacterized protein n=1 Tax=Dallia pectoralis TaxID=75939 RepID=A0ACC2F1B1_DALPE|nr:hypothetical protein DPEC_G00348950 [Dallia pectoralis]